MTSSHTNYVAFRGCSRRICCAWVLIFASILFSGCSSKRFPSYPVQQINQYSYHQEKGGLEVAIEPLLDKDKGKIEKYFGMNLLSSKIIPVFVVARNNSTSSSFVLAKDRFLLGDVTGSGNTINRSKIGDISSAQAVGIAGVLLAVSSPAILVSSPMVVAAASMASDAAEVKYNFELKQLRAGTLSPGEITSGFVYFPLPQKRDQEKWLNIHIEALDLREKKTYSFDVPFTLKRK